MGEMKFKVATVMLILLVVGTLTLAFVPARTHSTTVNSEETTLVIGTTDSVWSAIDPAQAYDVFGWEIIQNTGCGLVETEPGTGDIMPSLATSWSLTPDGLTWTFNLRQGVYFDENTTEFNVTHVQYSFDRAMMGIASPDGPQVNIGYDAIIDSVEVVSKYVVQFNLKIPFAPFLRLMACPASFIVNPAYAPFDQVVYYTEGNVRASTPMDLGPYKLTKWERFGGKDMEMWLEANPKYWRSGYPKTEKIIIKFYADATTLRLAIEAGDVDVAFRHITATDIEDLKDDPDLKVWEGTGAAIQYMVFQEAIPPLNDPRVRRAIAAALDRPTMCETVFLDQTSPLYSIIPDGMMGHTEAFAELGDANYTLTQSLLAELGYNENNKLAIDLWYETSGHYPASEDQAIIYKSSLEASNVIEVTLKSADWPSYRLNRNEGIMEVFIYGWYGEYIDPDNYALLYWATWLNHHYADYNATNHYFEMRAAYDAARETADEAERIELYAVIDNYAVADCPVVPLWQGRAYAVTKPDVKGVYLNVAESTHGLRMWYLHAGERYILKIFSSPSGITFTVNGVPHTTPWSGTYSEGASVSLTMTETYDGYEWSYWQEDADPNRIKTVTMDADHILTAVFVEIPPDGHPVASFTYSPSAPGVGETVSFDASASFDSDGTIVSYAWDFGDETTGTGVTSSHVYEVAGPYTVTLTVTDNDGLTGTTERGFDVYDVPPPNGDDVPPVADARTSDQTVETGTTVTFNGGGSRDNVGIASYEWNFGDQTFGTGVTATHTYTKEGTYTVTLTVTDAAGNSDKDTLKMTVGEASAREAVAPFPLWVLAPIIGGITGGTAVLVYLKRRKPKEEVMKPIEPIIAAEPTEIPVPAKKIEEEVLKPPEEIPPQKVEQFPKLSAKCSDTITLLNSFIEDPSRTNDRKAWKGFREFIAIAEQIEDEYAELIEIRNKLAILRRKRNEYRSAGHYDLADNVESAIQSNYGDSISIIKEIQKKLPQLGD